MRFEIIEANTEIDGKRGTNSRHAVPVAQNVVTNTHVFVLTTSLQRFLHLCCDEPFFETCKEC